MDAEKQRKIQYVLIGVALIVALLGSYFGVTLPTPEIPAADNTRSAGNTIQFRAIDVLNQIAGGTLSISGAASTGALSASSVTSTGAVSGTTITGSGAISGTTITGSGAISGATITSSGAITGTTITGSGAVTGAGVVSTAGVTVGTFPFITAGALVTVTNGSTITLATGYQPITAEGAVGTDSVSGCEVAGALSMLVNVGANAITITDTGTLMLSGDAALEQYDTLTLLGDGTNCIEIAESDN